MSLVTEVKLKIDMKKNELKYKNNVLNRSLRKILKDTGITRYRINKDLKISSATIKKWLTGETRIHEEEFVKIANLAGLSAKINVELVKNTDNE